MNVAVVGATGYIGDTLVKLLANHPKANLKTVTSRSKDGQVVSQVIPGLRGVLDDMVFELSDPQALAARDDIDCFFLAVPHGTATEYARPLVDAGKKVFDVSADYRTANSLKYEEFYGPHPDPDLLQQAQYVLPEITPNGWQEKPINAIPGCYPTTILVPLFPLLKGGVVGKEHIVVNSVSGASGAGRKAHEDFIFCEVTENAKPYSIPKHRHLSEIEEQLGQAGQGDVVIQFSPHLVPMKRGIVTTIIVPAGSSSIEDLYQCWQDAYSDRPFIYLLEAGQPPQTSPTVGTNRIDISAVKDDRTGNFVIMSAEDNLMKGASGQGIQIMNLWQGWDETTGLQ